MTSPNGNFSTLLVLCKGNPPVTGGFPSQRPVRRNFDVFFHLRLNKCRANNRDAGDLRCHRVHFDVTVLGSAHGFVAIYLVLYSTIFLKPSQTSVINFEKGIKVLRIGRKSSIYIKLLHKDKKYIAVTSHKLQGVSDRRNVDCLFDNCFMLTTKKIPEPCITGKWSHLTMGH